MLLEQVWNKGNLDLVDELIAARYTIHHDPGVRGMGNH